MPSLRGHCFPGRERGLDTHCLAPLSRETPQCLWSPFPSTPVAKKVSSPAERPLLGSRRGVGEAPGLVVPLPASASGHSESAALSLQWRPKALSRRLLCPRVLDRIESNQDRGWEKLHSPVPSVLWIWDRGGSL